MGFDNRKGGFTCRQPLPVQYVWENGSRPLSVLKSWRSTPMAVYDLASIHRWFCNSQQRILWFLWCDDFQLQSKSHCFRITYTTRKLHINWGESQVHTRSVAPWWNMTINVSSGLWPQTKGSNILCILTPWFPVNPISGLAVRPCKTNKINSYEKSKPNI